MLQNVIMLRKSVGNRRNLKKIAYFVFFNYLSEKLKLAYNSKNIFKGKNNNFCIDSPR